MSFTKCFLLHCKVAYPNLTKPKGLPATMPSEEKLLCSRKKDSKTDRLCCTITVKHTHYLVRTPHWPSSPRLYPFISVACGSILILGMMCLLNFLFVSWSNKAIWTMSGFLSDVVSVSRKTSLDIFVFIQLNRIMHKMILEGLIHSLTYLCSVVQMAQNSVLE